MKKKGFTLVELLAVIAILAILVIIALPNVLKMYNNAKKNTFLTEAKTVYSEVSKKYISESMKGNKLSYISGDDNTKLDMTGNNLKYCIKLDNNGKITAMKVGNDNYYIFYDGSKDISKLDINDVYEGKYVQNSCNANTIITKDGKPPAKACTYDGDINAGDAIQIGIYTYHYKQDYSLEDGKLTNITSDTFHVELTDKASTDAVTEAPCSSINGKLVTSMALMFAQSKVISINLSDFDTSKITNMAGMFGESSASALDLSSFDTSKVTDMSMMFTAGQATKIVGLNKFNTSNVTSMQEMFFASFAQTLDLSGFNTSKVTDMSYMFSYSQATTLDLSSFDTSKVSDMGMMFTASQATKIVGLNKFNTSNVTDMYGMFKNAKATTLDLSSFDTSKVTRMTEMFQESEATKIIGLNKFNTSKVTDMFGMFRNSAATTLDLSSFDTSNVTDMSSMFTNAKATTGYARTQADADKFNNSSNKPSSLTFVVK